MNILFGFLAVLAIIFLVPVVVYGVLSKPLGIKEPEKKASFFLGVLIEKIGTTAGFVSLFYYSIDFFIFNYLLFGLIWFFMFAIVEIGQVFTEGSPRKEALAGIISEAIYFPLAAFVLATILA